MVRNYLNFVSQKKIQIILFILLNLCGLLFVLLPYSIFWNMIDLYFSYSADSVFKSLYEMGENGRYVYLYSTLILDSFYPILYTSIILGAYVKLFKNNNILLLPVLAFSLDIVENINITYMNLTYLMLNKVQVAFASSITSLKWITIFIMVSILIYGYLIKRSNA